MARDPGRVLVPPVQRLRIRHAKRGPLRFTSHRDFQRAFERALRRAQVPMAYSAGFSPHPKISYANAAATGVASEAEYVEIGVVAECDPDRLRTELNLVLPEGLAILEIVIAQTPDLVARLEASVWEIELPEVSPAALAAALTAFLAQSEVLVQRMTKSGLRTFDARNAVASAAVRESAENCAILDLVVRHGTPAVRPDDVLVALREVGALQLPVAAKVTRIAQGPLLDDHRSVGDPLAADRSA